MSCTTASFHDLSIVIFMIRIRDRTEPQREEGKRVRERESRSIRILVVGPNSRSRRRQRLDADLNIESHRLRTIIYLRNSDDGSNTSRRPYVRTCSTKFGRKEYKTFSNFS